ncbi:hypothetical protein Egran_04596, partial [Elaphomyces granulatus]
GFYDPINDRFKEPSLTGISYSFTDDGFYEEAYYRALSNPTNPQCPEGLMQWQHGTYSKESNGSLVLTPFAVDGRQLLSSPCSGDYSVYSRYNQTEVFRVGVFFSRAVDVTSLTHFVLQSYRVYNDPFHHVLRLDLYQWDGTPVNTLYLIYKPPEMLPTTTINPIHKATATGRTKRNTDDATIEPLNKNVLLKRADPMNPANLWWIGLIMTSLGGIALFFS